MKPWNPPPGLKFPCPLANHKQEVSTRAEFFNLSPLDRWEKIEKGRMKYSCLKPKCAICASWLASFSIFFCKQKHHGDSRAQLTDLRKELEKYIGKLGSTVVDSKIQFSGNFLFKKTKKVKSTNYKDSCQESSTLSPAPTFDSKTEQKSPIPP